MRPRVYLGYQGCTQVMANDHSDKKPGLFGQFLASVGLNKPEPPQVRGHSTGRIPGAGARGADTSPLSQKKAATAPLSPEDKAKQSEERRYLIAAFETTPTLIPEFQNPQYMYKMISNERDYAQEVLNALLMDRRQLLHGIGPDRTEEQDEQLEAIDRRAQALRNDLTRYFQLIKRVAGIQKSGTGGTDFLDPFKN